MKRISILIADDEEEIADAIHLEKEGYNVIKVHNGQEHTSYPDKEIYFNNDIQQSGAIVEFLINIISKQHIYP